jgi:hypothetical protein
MENGFSAMSSIRLTFFSLAHSNSYLNTLPACCKTQMAQLPNILIYQKGHLAKLQALASHNTHASSSPIIAEVLAWPSPWGCTLVTLLTCNKYPVSFSGFELINLPSNVPYHTLLYVLASSCDARSHRPLKFTECTLHFTSQSLRPSL